MCWTRSRISPLRRPRSQSTFLTASQATKFITTAHKRRLPMLAAHSPSAASPLADIRSPSCTRTILWRGGLACRSPCKSRPATTAASVTVELVPGAAISGHIVDEDGDPLPGCMVEVHSAKDFNQGTDSPCTHGPRRWLLSVIRHPSWEIHDNRPMYGECLPTASPLGGSRSSAVRRLSDRVLSPRVNLSRPRSWSYRLDRRNRASTFKCDLSLSPTLAAR